MVYRSYALPHAANAGKCATIAGWLPDYQRVLCAVVRHQHREYLNGAALRPHARLGYLTDSGAHPFTARMLNSVQVLAVAALQSMEALTQERFLRLINGSSVTGDLRRHLFALNVKKAWYRKARVLQGKERDRAVARRPDLDLAQPYLVLTWGKAEATEAAEDETEAAVARSMSPPRRCCWRALC